MRVGRKEEESAEEVDQEDDGDGEGGREGGKKREKEEKRRHGEDRRLLFCPLPLSSSRTCTHEKRKESELSSRLPCDGSNFHRKERRVEKERRDGEVRLSISRKR